MLNYVHGGDIQTYIDRHGFAPLDLSANINPFGIPDAVRAAMHRLWITARSIPTRFAAPRGRRLVREKASIRIFCTAATVRRMCSTVLRRC